MKKFLISGSVVLALAFSSPVLAQNYSYASPSGGCVSIPAGLSMGSRGGDVTNLQNFLVAQNYPGGGSWMVTGYFGAATAAAVKNFQQAHGLPQTGAVDQATASFMSSCQGAGSGSFNFNYNYPNNTLYPGTVYPTYTNPSYPSSGITYYPGSALPLPNTYPYSGNQYYYGNQYYAQAPVITSLSQNTGMPGQSVTMYGVGFDYSNTVNFGSVSVQGISQSGNSITFVIPSYYQFQYSYTGTTVQISVTNSRGTSNHLDFTVWGGYSGCQGTYLYGASGNCGCSAYAPAGSTYGYPYNYNNCNPSYPPNNTQQPTIHYLSPTYGAVGTSVTVYGTGFTTTGNSVRFGTGVIAGLNSYDGRSVSFIVPTTLSGFGSQPITLTTYQVSVVNGLGISSNSLPFSVTGTIGSGQPTIASVTGPTSLATGQQGVWQVSVNAASNTYLSLSVNWGDNNSYAPYGASQSSVQQYNTLTHTYYQAGTYNIAFTVTNSQGQQNSYTTTVVVR